LIVYLYRENDLSESSEGKFILDKLINDPEIRKHLLKK